MDRRTQLKIALLLCILVAIVAPRAKAYSGGSGAAEDPYQIATAEDLIALGNEPNDYDKHFILMADIDFAGYTFDQAIIAPDTDPSLDIKHTFFSGSFFGNNHILRNLHIEGARYLGLFGRTTAGAVISNLGLEDLTIHSDNYFVGGLVADNCGTLFECFSYGDVSGANDHIGGLVGANSGIVLNCHSQGQVTGRSSVGGLIGSSNGYISNSYSNGTIVGDYAVGGLLGRNEYGNISNCYSTASIGGSGWSVGGLIGRNDGRSSYRYVLNCYSTGRVVGAGKLGGLIGDGDDSHVLRCFWDTGTSGVTVSAGGFGLTTAEMQDPNTYLTTGWDFVSEGVKGTAQVWQMPELGGYPALRTLQDEGGISLQGQGVAGAPFLITSVQELRMVRYRPFACYRLEADIDFSAMVWVFSPIPWFGGHFDGNGHAIRHLCIQGEEKLGLFGILHAWAVITDLALEEGDVRGTGSEIGALAGCGDGRIQDCHSDVAVAGRSSVGGLLGNSRGVLVNCSSDGETLGSASCVGGLVGRYYNGEVSNCSSAGVVTGDDRVGGLIGYIGDCNVAECYSSSVVTGNEILGGLIGCNSYHGLISKSHSIGSVGGVDCYIGGLVGDNRGTIFGCYSTGQVVGAKYVGGLTGLNSTDQVVSNSYSSGAVFGESRVGGLVGQNRGYVLNCYGIGAVSAIEYLGGLVGSNWWSVEESFWDIQSSRQTESSGGTGLTMAEMMDMDTFIDAEWDFVGETDNGTKDIWWIDDGVDYPRLWWEVGE